MRIEDDDIIAAIDIITVGNGSNGWTMGGSVGYRCYGRVRCWISKWRDGVPRSVGGSNMDILLGGSYCSGSSSV